MSKEELFNPVIKKDEITPPAVVPDAIEDITEDVEKQLITSAQEEKAAPTPEEAKEQITKDLEEAYEDEKISKDFVDKVQGVGDYTEDDKSGFSVIAVVLGVIAVSIIGVIGLLFFKDDSDTGDSTAKSTEQTENNLKGF